MSKVAAYKKAYDAVVIGAGKWVILPNFITFFHRFYQILSLFSTGFTKFYHFFPLVLPNFVTFSTGLTKFCHFFPPIWPNFVTFFLWFYQILSLFYAIYSFCWHFISFHVFIPCFYRYSSNFCYNVFWFDFFAIAIFHLSLCSDRGLYGSKLNFTQVTMVWLRYVGNDFSAENLHKAERLNRNGTWGWNNGKPHGAKRGSNGKAQVKFAPCDSPWERPCFNSGTVSTQGLCFVWFF